MLVKIKSQSLLKILNASLLSIFFLLLIYRILFMVNKPLLVEEAYYWNYAQHLDFSYLDHPPMVALLIKIGTLIWGDTEWGIRFLTIPCWLLTIFFSYRLTQIIAAGSEKYTLLFLSFLPFFFIHSLIITPDIPLIMAWSASLLYLYKATALNKPIYWYAAGFWIGIGLLSKYTIVLLGIATLFYLLIIPQMRYWFVRKEPYLAACIALLVFSPVIYWNYSHHWASFLFQTSNRFHASDSSTFHLLLGLIILFFTPMGILETARIFFVSQKDEIGNINTKTKLFFLCYTLTPVLFFGFFSIFHQIKFNWIGTSTLAIIPWFSISLQANRKMMGLRAQTSWAITVFITVCIYILLFTVVFFKWPQFLNDRIPALNFDWKKTSFEIYNKAVEMNERLQEKPVIVALDTYNLASELIFYQKMFKKRQQISTIYPVLGASLFGLNSVMYRYWDNILQADEKYLLLVSDRLYSFDVTKIRELTKPMTPVTLLNEKAAKLFYYQLVKMK